MMQAWLHLISVLPPERSDSIDARCGLNVRTSLLPERSRGKSPLGPSVNTLSNTVPVFVVTFGVFHKPLKNSGQYSTALGSLVHSNFRSSRAGLPPIMNSVKAFRSQHSSRVMHSKCHDGTLLRISLYQIGP